mgnify:CR=1 FL=1
MGILRTDKLSGLETPTAVTGSVSFDGTGDYLSLADSNDWYLGNGDFTVEAHIYGNSFGSFNGIVGQWPSSGGNTNNSFVFEVVGGELEFYYSVGSTLYGPIQGAKVSTQEWHHVAATRSGNTMYIFLDGVMFGSGDTSVTHTFNDPSSSLTVGGNIDSAGYFNGYISNVRILKGTALYTANFTPPVHELQQIGDTVLLCCNNPDSAGAEATGKAITVNGDAAASTVSPGLTRDFTFGTQFQGVAKFDTQGYFVPPSGTTEQRGAGRGILYGGYRYNPNANQTIIESIQISSSGNAQKFGDIDVVRYGSVGVASPTRGVFAGGEGSPAKINTIQYVLISSQGDAVDFGDLTTARMEHASFSNAHGGL